MAEGESRRFLLKALRPLHGVHVENVMQPGMCDINYVEGWIELKWLAAWPKRAETVVRVSEFTAQQRVFLIKRVLASGQARVLLRVGNEWTLLPGLWAALHLGRDATKSALLAAAERYWPRGLAGKELVAYLRTQPKSVADVQSFLKESAIISSVLEEALTST